TSGKLDNMRLNTGSGGGIDSDMLDGSHASAFATSGHGHDLQDLGGAVTDDQVPNSITVDYAAQAGTATSATNAGNANTVGGYTAAQLATQMDTKISTHNTEVTAHNDLRSQIAANTPPGTIVQYAGATAPTGWLICNGTSVSTTTYAALYAVIGYTYGGSGSTFSLPNLVGKVAVGKSISSPFDTLGNTGGEITHLLTAAEMPSHTHTQNQHGHAIHNGYGGPNGIGASAESGSDDNNWSFQDRMFASQFAFVADYTTATNQNTGGGQAHNNLQPYLVLNYIIKY
ncbi:MAG TPA: tail fiber protein, partial [Candidatus Hydrogenedentes bacterium]|nr:tail fiber protein [Candidatus Hydrogenedentota bacterium]